MPPSSVRTNFPQTGNVLPHCSAQVVFDLEGREVCVQVEDLLVLKFAELHGLVEVEAGHDLARQRGTDAIESLESFLCERRISETSRDGDEKQQVSQTLTRKAPSKLLPKMLTWI